MADGNELPLMLGTGVEATDGMLLMSGEVHYKGKSHQFHLTNSELRLVRSHVPQRRKTTNSTAVFDVKWRNVLCACEPVKKSRPSQSCSNAGSADGRQSSVFSIHYCVKNQKTNKVQHKHITLETKAGNTGQWISQIEDKCKQGKPKKLLIIINPIGGKGTARQTFEKRVQPLFALAGIELIVKVTEKAKHAVEIAKTFDVSSVDGVIAMGGDGMYMEILHGLMLRKQEEDGVDFNDPDARLSPPSVSVGIIPAGTGNGVSGWLNGVVDLDTATLNIIQGETRKTNIFSIHESGRLIHYAGLLVGNGYFSQMIQRTDELRWMKRARYPYAAVSSLFGKKQILEFDIEVLRNEPGPAREDGRPEGAEAMSSGWTRLGPKRLVATMAFSAKILDGGERLEMHPFYPGFDFIILDKSSALENFRFIVSLFTRSRQALDRDYVEWVRDIRGARLQMVEGKEDGTANRRQQEQVLDLCKLLDVDGEIMHLSSPKFEVRLHPQFLPVFCVPELYSVV